MNPSNHNAGKPDSSDKQTESQAVGFGVRDLFLLLFYLIIIAIGILLVRHHGENASLTHMAGIALCLCGITTLKFSKYRNALKEHATEMILLVCLFACSLFALFAHLL